MTIKEWSSCPACKLPAIYSDFKRLLENEPVCPMCEQNVPAMSITLASDPEAEFKALTALMKDSGPNEAAEDAEGEGDDDDEDI
jgi:hypothetical protein